MLQRCDLAKSRKFFNENGFLIQENAFSDAECAVILSRLMSELPRYKAGVRGLMRYDFVKEIATDERLIGLTKELTARELIPYKATLFEKTGKANWLVSHHQDTALPVEEFAESDEWTSPSTKDGVKFMHAPTEILRNILAVRINLDASTRFNGPLRVIPRTHRKKLITDEEFEAARFSAEEVICETDRGGVIAMSPLILHASSKCQNDEPRRVLHIEYAPKLDAAVGVRLAIF